MSAYDYEARSRNLNCFLVMRWNSYRLSGGGTSEFEYLRSRILRNFLLRASERASELQQFHSSVVWSHFQSNHALAVRRLRAKNRSARWFSVQPRADIFSIIAATTLVLSDRHTQTLALSTVKDKKSTRFGIKQIFQFNGHGIFSVCVCVCLSLSMSLSPLPSSPFVVFSFIKYSFESRALVAVYAFLYIFISRSGLTPGGFTLMLKHRSFIVA